MLAISVQIKHSLDLPGFVHLVVLYDAHAVDPEKLAAKGLDAFCGSDENIDRNGICTDSSLDAHCSRWLRSGVIRPSPNIR